MQQEANMEHFPWWKSLLLQSYYTASYPARWWSNAVRRAEGRAPIMVLFYHRIADDRANSWTTHSRVFKQQMRWLKTNFDMVTLAEAQRRIASPGNSRPCVSVTFDDGYGENYGFALPLLLAEKIPCTYFVSTDFTFSGQPFPHDIALGQPARPNTAAEIRELSDAGIEIGAHTRSHVNMGQVQGMERLYDELVVPKQQLEEITGRSVRYFAFPYGHPQHMSREAFAVAKQYGYEGVCSAYGGYNFAGDDPFHIQRIHADDDLLRLKNWMTLDPRKLRATERYEYREAHAGTCVAGAA